MSSQLTYCTITNQDWLKCFLSYNWVTEALFAGLAGYSKQAQE